MDHGKTCKSLMTESQPVDLITFRYFLPDYVFVISPANSQDSRFNVCMHLCLRLYMQFVNFTTIMSKYGSSSEKESAFALAALMEVPIQYKAVMELGLLG